MTAETFENAVDRKVFREKLLVWESRAKRRANRFAKQIAKHLRRRSL